MNRQQRVERIERAEANGFVRVQPYLALRCKVPRWYRNGSYYSYSELP